MAEGLFRKEVLAAQQTERLGTIQLQPPRFGWLFLGFGATIVVLMLGVLVFGHYTRHERVDGALVPSGGLIGVAPMSSGIVVRALVHEGDAVKAGQALLEVSSEQDSAALGNTRAAVLDQLHIKQTRLQSELSETSQLTASQRQELTGRVAMLQAQVKQIGEQVALQKERVDSSRALYEQWANLRESGVITKLQILQQHDITLQNEVQLKELNRQQLGTQQQLAQAQSELQQLPANLQTKRDELARQVADVAQSISENEAQRAVVLRATADGTVANMLVHVGQAVAAQQTLLTVLPTHASLQAELWLPSKAAGFVSPGDRVVLRYQAYPYQRFGQHSGRVDVVSRSAVAPAELARLLGHEVTEPRYRVLVSLDAQQVEAYGQREALKPGMGLDADILLDRRRLIEWVLDPMRGMVHAVQSPATKEGRTV
jgi:membrane fusion protein